MIFAKCATCCAVFIRHIFNQYFESVWCNAMKRRKKIAGSVNTIRPFMLLCAAMHEHSLICLQFYGRICWAAIQSKSYCSHFSWIESHSFRCAPILGFHSKCGCYIGVLWPFTKLTLCCFISSESALAN